VLQIIEKGSAVHVLERRLACTHAVQEIAICVPDPALAVECSNGTQRTFGMRSQMLAQRSQLEAPICELAHDPEIGERAQDAIQLLRPTAARRCQRSYGARTCLQLIGNPQRRRDVQQLRGTKAHDHLLQLDPVLSHAPIEAAAIGPRPLPLVGRSSTPSISGAGPTANCVTLAGESFGAGCRCSIEGRTARLCH
jgi:hypothetical protein